MNVMIPGQSPEDRGRMADVLRMYGFMDSAEYSTVTDFLRSLPQLDVDSDLRFFLDTRIFKFLASVWGEEQRHRFDIFLLFRIYDALIDRHHGIRSISRPYRPTLSYRDPNAVTGV